MRKLFFSFLVILTLVLSACSERDNSDSVAFLIPWQTSGGDYQLQVVKTPSLKDITKVSGEAARLYVSPGADDSGLKGESPNAQFSKTDSYYVPKDVVSQELVTVYAHMERLKTLDESIGLGNILSWPRWVGVEVLARSKKRHFEHDNASYYDKWDATFFFPYTTKNKLPLAVNGGVIAHEHFHALFYQLVIKPLEDSGFQVDWDKKNIKSKKDLITGKNNHFIIRAFNEGFADLWALVYTEDNDFLSKSVAKNYSAGRQYESLSIRDLGQEIVRITDRTKWDDVGGRAYVLGAQIAKLVKIEMDDSVKLKIDKSLGVSQKSYKELKAAFVIDLTKKIASIFHQKYQDREKLKATDILNALYKKENLDKLKCDRIRLATMEGDLLNTCHEQGFYDTPTIFKDENGDTFVLDKQR